ncbi:uncharacterized protein LOC108903566 [Anoplophora glabripennis]|uniref:uncharacterized protein LOC108903566 n=1 Tax=Anoplophora glabripennis TaxID=217634 RepID=UPI00087507D4|nr:uncharacterized protein LOC108903566 [Anoplophora glabripennis]
MKFCIFVILVCLQTTIPLAQGQNIRDRINEIIQNIKNQIPEPVEMTDTSVALPENDNFGGCINITNWTISGLRDFNIDVDYSGTIIPIPRGFTITIDSMDMYRDLLASFEAYYRSSILHYESDASFDIQNILGDRFSRLLSTILSNTVADFLNLVQEPVSERLVDIINSIIRDILQELNEVNTQKMSAATSQERAMEDLGRFLEILENRMGLKS